MSINRVHHLMLMGVRPLNRDAWATLVATAQAAVEARYATLRGSFTEVAPTPHKHAARPVWICPEQMVIDAQIVLGVEMALVEAESLASEIEDLARDDVDSARRARLMNTIERCRDLIAKRLASEPS